MNFNPVIRRRLALVSAFSAALIATGYAASEHNRADWLEQSAAECAAQTSYKETAAATEESATAAEETPLPKVRQAARDFILEKKPGAKVEGVFTLALGRDSGLYIAGADATLDGQRRTVDLLVRLYTRKGGGTYYRAEGLSPEQAATMRERAQGIFSAPGAETTDGRGAE